MVLKASEIWRDYETDGIPATGENDPDKAQIRNWGTYLEGQIGVGGVADRTALKALNTALTSAVYLREAGREGVFVFRSGDYSAQITADTNEGVYIEADDTSSSYGCWVRESGWAVEGANPKWFGVQGDAVEVAATASIASGAAALTATGASFTSDDVGKIISVPGAGAGGVALQTTIAAVGSATSVTLADNASTTLSSASVTLTYGTDDSAAFNAALSGGNVHLNVPAGDYIFGSYLRVFAKTWLVLHPAARLLNALTDTYGALFLNGELGNTTYATGYDGDGDIWFSGGKIDLSLRSATEEISQAIAFAHAENVLIESMIFYNCYDSHHIEINSSKNVRITRCTFDRLTTGTSSVTHEDINIDHAYSTGFPHFGSYDDTVCRDVSIYENEFRDGIVGVGSHAGVATAHLNINVYRNRFYNMSSRAIRAHDWNRGIIAWNEIDTCGLSAMLFYDANFIKVFGNFIKNVNEDSADDAIVISGNSGGGEGCEFRDNRIVPGTNTTNAFGVSVGTKHRIDTSGAEEGSSGLIDDNGTLTEINGRTLLWSGNDGTGPVSLDDDADEFIGLEIQTGSPSSGSKTLTTSIWNGWGGNAGNFAVGNYAKFFSGSGSMVIGFASALDSLTITSAADNLRYVFGLNRRRRG
ncbi:MAG: hypothetical protein KDJ90_12785 [Nitratireductor sp.]|nr:hypothetical protein [Nitratireductor sp.]